MKLFLRSLFLTLMFFFAPAAFGDTPPAVPPVVPPVVTPPATVTISREDLDRLIAEAAKGKGTPPPNSPPPPETDPLRTKVKTDRELADARTADSAAIERSLQFTMTLDTFVKDNADLLPSEIVEIVKVANAVTYDTQIEKAAAVRKSVIECYFSVQENLDSLTPGQRRDLDDYLKLTKNGKEEKAATIYVNIFEPALEMSRRLKKAAELRRGDSGIQTTSGTEAAWRDKIIAASKQKYLGIKP